MPSRHGYETLERLKFDSSTRDIPVIIFEKREILSHLSGAGAMPEKLSGLVNRYSKPVRIGFSR